MAVAFDAQSSATTPGTGATSLDHTNLTVGSGSNRALVAVLCIDGNAVTGLSATWDQGASNQSMTLIRQQSSGTSGAQTVALFGLVNPVSGNKTLRVSWSSGAADAVVAAASFTGVDQTGGATSFPNSTGGDGTTSPATVTVTSATDDYTVAGHCTDSGSVTAVNNTSIFVDDTRPNISTGGNRAAGAASVTLTATLSANVRWTSAGTSIKASTATAVQPKLMLLGVG